MGITARPYSADQQHVGSLPRIPCLVGAKGRLFHRLCLLLAGLVSGLSALDHEGKWTCWPLPSSHPSPGETSMARVAPVAVSCRGSCSDHLCASSPSRDSPGAAEF